MNELVAARRAWAAGVIGGVLLAAGVGCAPEARDGEAPATPAPIAPGPDAAPARPDPEPPPRPADAGVPPSGGGAPLAPRAAEDAGPPPADAARASDPEAGRPAPPVHPTADGPRALVAVGLGGRRLSSFDGGKTWAHEAFEARPGGDDDDLLRGVGYGAGLFVAVGGGPRIRMLVSRDGKSWTKPTYPAGQWLGGVAFGGGTWVAVGGLGRRLHSADGMTWRDAPAAGQHLRSVAYGNGKFVAVGSSRCTSSEDGLRWTPLVPCAGWERVAAGGGRFVGISIVDRGYSHSDDGVTWTNGTLPRQGRDVVFAGDRFVVAASGGMLTSPDGRTWTSHTSGAVDVLGFDGASFAGASGGALKASSDGVTWGAGAAAGNSITRLAGGRLSP